jgi:hypothetical protein
VTAAKQMPILALCQRTVFALRWHDAAPSHHGHGTVPHRQLVLAKPYARGTDMEALLQLKTKAPIVRAPIMFATNMPNKKEDDFLEWLTNAKPKHKYCYYVGMLTDIRHKNSVARFMYGHATAGNVYLVQKKVNPFCYEYYAIKASVKPAYSLVPNKASRTNGTNASNMKHRNNENGQNYRNTEARHT